MGCEYKACVNEAKPNSRFCVNHSPAEVPTGEQDVLIVSIAEVPAPHQNEVATTIFRSVKILTDGKALKVRLRKFSKSNLECTKRYALSEGLRIGIRYTGEWAFVWKLNAEQIKAVEEKARRLVAARAKKKK